MSSTREQDQDWVCVGVFQGAHGVRGDVKLRTYTENPKSVPKFKDLRLGPDGQRVVILSSRSTKSGLVVRVEGVSQREAAQALNGQELFVTRASFPELKGDEVYLSDLEGLDVLEDGKKIGTVSAVHNFGSEDLLDLQLDEPLKVYGKSLMVPFRRDVVPDVDIEKGSLSIRLTEWLDGEIVAGDEDGNAE